MAPRNQNDRSGWPRGSLTEVRDNNIKQAMGRLKKILQNEGLFKELRERQFFEKPSMKRKKARAAARKRHLKERAQQRDW